MFIQFCAVVVCYVVSIVLYMYVLIEACQDRVAGNNELISPTFMEGIFMCKSD